MDLLKIDLSQNSILFFVGNNSSRWLFNVFVVQDHARSVDFLIAGGNDGADPHRDCVGRLNLILSMRHHIKFTDVEDHLSHYIIDCCSFQRQTGSGYTSYIS